MRRNPQYRFLLNDSPTHLEVHDLDNEKAGCKINEIQRYRYLTGTSKSDVKNWLNQNSDYDGCAYCLPEYHSK